MKHIQKQILQQVCPDAVDQTFKETKGKYLTKSSTELDSLKRSKPLTGLLWICWS